MTSEARQLYLDLALLSHGSVTSWSAGSGVPGSREPTGESRPPHELFAAEYERKGQSAVTHWRAFLAQWRGHNTVKPAESSEDEWILQDGRGQAPDVVAQRFRCTPTRVRRLRVSAGLDVETGKHAEGDGPVGNVERAVWLVSERGFSVRQAALVTGVAKSTISDRRKAA